MADIRLAKPVAGTTQTVPSAPDGRFIFDFPADAATLTRNGDDLVLSFEDGSSIRLQGFYTTYSKEEMPSFQVEGVEISGQDFFAALGEDLMPAAGPAAGSSASRGGRYNEYGGSDLLDGVDHLGRLDIGFGDGVEWADDQVGGWTHQNLDPEISGIIAVDGEVLFLDGITSETFHALQWHDGAGHVEPGDGLPNEELSTDDYAGRVAPFVALWEEEKARLEEEANRPPTDEELAAQAVAEARAQSSSILIARMQADMVQTGAFAAAEFATFAKAGLFTDWAAGQTYAKAYRLAHKGIVYEVMQEVTALENQPPDATGMLAVYRPLSVDPETGEEPDGSREHPFAFLYGMDVTKDSYYTYEGKLWLAKADMPACVWTPGTAGLWQWEEASAA